MYNSFVML